MLVISVVYSLILWVIFSQQITLSNLILGGIFSLITCFIAKKLSKDYNIKPRKIFLYSLWLFKEIILSSYNTILMIWGIKKIDPVFLEVEMGELSELGHVIYDNSITLTPGTVCVNDHGKIITIHSLSTELSESIINGDLEKKVRKVL